MDKPLLQSNRQAVAKGLISLIIIATVSVQAYTAFLKMACSQVSIPLYCDLPQDPGLYPFVSYPMYSEVKPEGVSVSHLKLIAIFSDGTEKQMAPEDFHISPYWFNTRLLPAFREKQASKVTAYIAAYEAAGNPSPNAIRFETNSSVIIRKGVTEGKTTKSFTTSLPMIPE